MAEEQARPPAWYLDWVGMYMTAFGRGESKYTKAANAWWPAFAGMNYSRAELEAATVAVLSLPADDTPSFADEHLAAVKRAVGTARNEARAKEVEMRDAGRGETPAPFQPGNSYASRDCSGRV